MRQIDCFDSFTTLPLRMSFQVTGNGPGPETHLALRKTGCPFHGARCRPGRRNQAGRISQPVEGDIARPFGASQTAFCSIHLEADACRRARGCTGSDQPHLKITSPAFAGASAPAMALSQGPARRLWLQRIFNEHLRPFPDLGDHAHVLVRVVGGHSGMRRGRQSSSQRCR